MTEQELMLHQDRTEYAISRLDTMCNAACNKIYERLRPRQQELTPETLVQGIKENRIMPIPGVKGINNAYLGDIFDLSWHYPKMDSEVYTKRRDMASAIIAKAKDKITLVAAQEDFAGILETVSIDLDRVINETPNVRGNS